MTAFPELAEPDLPTPPQGSAEWHALLFAPVEHRGALLAALTCRREILQTVRGAREDLVARVRLGWWQEEVMLLAQRRPRHPATQRLVTTLRHPEEDATPLKALVAAADRDLARHRYDDFAALTEHCMADGGAFFEFLVRVMSPHAPSAATVTAARRLGAGSRLVEIIRELHRDAAAERFYLPSSVTKELGVSAQAHTTAPPSAGLREALAMTAEQARETFRNGLKELPATERNIATTPLVLAALQARLLRRLERRRFDVIGHWTELSSASKLWTAWNAARRSLRGQPPRLVGIRS